MTVVVGVDGWLINHGREAEAEEAMRRIEEAAISDGQHLEPVPESAAITILPETSTAT